MRQVVTLWVILFSTACNTAPVRPVAEAPPSLTCRANEAKAYTDESGKYLLTDCDGDNQVDKIERTPGIEQPTSVFYIVESNDQARRLNKSYIEQHVLPLPQRDRMCESGVGNPSVEDTGTVIDDIYGQGSVSLAVCRDPGYFVASWYIPRLNNRSIDYQRMFEEASLVRL